MKPASPTRVVRTSTALWRQTLRGVVVLGPDDEQPQVLAPPGDAIWAGLADPIEPETLVARLAADFGAPDAVVRADVTRFLEDLLRRGLVVEVNKS